MSTLTARSALVLQLALIDATPCGKCGHSLKQHPLSVTEGTRCHHHEFTPRVKNCKCAAFVEPSEQLPIGGDK